MPPLHNPQQRPCVQGAKPKAYTAFILQVTEDGAERTVAKRYSDFEAVHMELGDNIAFPSKAAFALNFFAVRTSVCLHSLFAVVRTWLVLITRSLSITLSCTA